VGDKELDESGTAIAEIVWLGDIKPHEYEFDIGGGEKITKEDQDLKDVFAKIKLKGEIKNKDLYYKKNAINIDSSFKFHTDKYTLEVMPAILRMYKKEEIYLEIDCKLIKVKPETLKLIKVGDKELDESGTAIAEIVWLGDIKPHEYEFNIGGGEKITKEDQDLKDIFAKIKLRAEMIGVSNTIFYKGERLMVDFPIGFHLNDYYVEAVPYVMSKKENLKEKWVQVKVKFSSVAPELAKVIQEKDVETDPTGRVVGILRNIISDKPSEILIMEKKQQWLTINHPFMKDIELILDVLGVEKEGVLYFKNYPIKIGNNIVFTSNIYSISGLIVGLEIK
jgi:hypothetical protein